MRPKVMILGNTGMLGEVVEKYFQEKDEFEIKGVNTKHFDATNLESVEKLFIDDDWQYVINCVGILNNKTDKDLYAKVNIVFPHYLQHLSKVYDFKLIHISTNCVFADSDRMHHRTDKPDATDLYGQSKYFGEIVDKKNLTIRTSIIGQSQNGSGLLNWFLNNESNIVTGYVNARWNGVTTLAVAKLLHEIIDYETKNNKNNFYGLMQYSSWKPTTKYELLCMFNEIYNKDRVIVEDTKKRMHTSLLQGDMCPNNGIEEQIREFKKWYK